jgi:hypothetical protein
MEWFLKTLIEGLGLGLGFGVAGWVLALLGQWWRKK